MVLGREGAVVLFQSCGSLNLLEVNSPVAGHGKEDRTRSEEVQASKVRNEALFYGSGSGKRHFNNVCERNRRLRREDLYNRRTNTT